MSYACLLLALVCLAVPAMAADSNAGSPLGFTVKANDGSEVKLDQYKGKVVMFVNVASQCGYTPQYKNLEAVYEKYKDKGFVILGFPCNDFGAQEPGTDKEILQFCSSKFHVTFPLMSKIKVQGAEADPLYKYLTQSSAKPGKIEWNFTKFLIGRDGQIINRYPSKIKPDDPLPTTEIETALAAK